MNKRVNAFADLGDSPPVFTIKPKKETRVAEEAITRIADENNFPSRQASRTAKEPRRKRRQYTTGRNQQLNFKASGQTVERFYRIADERSVPLCELLEQALDALERPGNGT